MIHYFCGSVEKIKLSGTHTLSSTIERESKRKCIFHTIVESWAPSEANEWCCASLVVQFKCFIAPKGKSTVSLEKWSRQLQSFVISQLIFVCYSNLFALKHLGVKSKTERRYEHVPPLSNQKGKKLAAAELDRKQKTESRFHRGSADDVFETCFYCYSFHIKWHQLYTQMWLFAFGIFIE